MPETGLRKWLITFTVLLATVIELIDTSIVNVALPQMMGNLGATLDEITWVVTAYVVANVIVIPLAGWLAAQFGRRNYFVSSIVVFTVSSFFCGHAGNIWELVAFRFVQGMGGGALLTTSLAILVETFPPEELSVASGLFGMGAVLGPTLGPVLGGWLTDNLSWPWIFYVNLPIGVLATLLALAFVRDPAHRHKPGNVDWWGIGLLVVGVGSLQTVLERGQTEDWFSSRFIVALSVLSALGLFGFVWRELTTPHPAVDLRVLRQRPVAVGTFLTFILGFGMYASLFIFPVFVQGLLGFTALQTGVVLLADGLACALSMVIVGKLIEARVSKRLLSAAGFVLFSLALYLLSRSTLESGRHDFVLPLMWRGIGLALMFVPVMTLALVGLQGPDIAQGSGLTNMMRQLGGSFGVALITTFVQRTAWAHRASLLSHLSPFDPAAQARVEGFTQGLILRGSTPVVARQQAYAALELTVQRQTYLMSYMDAFRIIAVFFLVCVPLVLLFKKDHGGGTAMIH